MKNFWYSVVDEFKTAAKRLIQKRAESIDDLIGNKIADAVGRCLYYKMFQTSQKHLCKQKKI